MKSLPEKVRAVNRLMKRLDTDILRFRQWSKIGCISGCGECCKKPDIEATPLEFLPLALYLFDQGKAEEALASLGTAEDPLCFLFRPNVTRFGGLCQEYPYRGLICRLFGFSARIAKSGEKELVTCRIIKESQPEFVAHTGVAMNSGEPIPVMSEYYSRLQGIDHLLTGFFPINEAIRQALETVLHYYSYRKRRRPVNK